MIPLPRALQMSLRHPQMHHARSSAIVGIEWVACGVLIAGTSPVEFDDIATEAPLMCYPVVNGGSDQRSKLGVPIFPT